jgi:homoserine kinase
VIVRAPATTANLGPGFDVAGVALDLWNELEVTEGPADGIAVEIEGEGASELPRDATNIALRAYALAAPLEGKRFRFVNRIPLERGLGSSAAAIALGLAAARPEASAEELLALGEPLEGHGDNLAAALTGGAVLTWSGRVAKLADRLPLDAVAVVPAERTSTEGSRATLPVTVAHADAAFTAARAALLGAAIAGGDAELFAAALEDRLHEPYRPSRLLEELRADLPEGAAGATLSGSGPTVIVWARDAEAAAAELAERYPSDRVLPLAVAPRGAL